MGLEKRSIRETLGTIITPSVRDDTSFLPKFSVVVKNQRGSLAVAERDYWHVSRWRNACLQCLGKIETYGSNAYVICMIYYGESLDLYTQYLTQLDGLALVYTDKWFDLGFWLYWVFPNRCTGV